MSNKKIQQVIKHATTVLRPELGTTADKLNAIKLFAQGIGVSDYDICSFMRNEKVSFCSQLQLLPLVYRNDKNELEVINQYIEDNKDNIWGIYLGHNIHISLNALFIIDRQTYSLASDVAERNKKNGHNGRLPRLSELEKWWNKGIVRSYNRTIEMLEDKGFKIRRAKEFIWCNDDHTPSKVYAFDFLEGKAHILNKDALSGIYIAICFD